MRRHCRAELIMFEGTGNDLAAERVLSGSNDENMRRVHVFVRDSICSIIFLTLSLYIVFHRARRNGPAGKYVLLVGPTFAFLNILLLKLH